MRLKIVLDERRKSKAGYHIKLRVTFSKTKDDGTKRHYHKLYPTGIYAVDARALNQYLKNPRGDEQVKYQTTLMRLELRAIELIASDPFIDPEAFGNELFATGSYDSPLEALETYEKELRNDGRVGTAEYYRQARSSFTEYSKGHLSFGTITPGWLRKYEKHMKDKGRSVTTVGMYCRAMRTIFNLAIQKRKLNETSYPFGKGKYEIPTGKGRKIALSEADKNKLLTHAFPDSIQWAVDMWKFSYFINGINMMDVALLKFKNVQGDFIRFERHKTKLTSRERIVIEAFIVEEVRKIIAKWCSRNISPDGYLFPVLEPGLTPEQIKDRVHDFIKDVNAGLKQACEEIKIPVITTYSARHTFATIAMIKGAGIEFIQKALGHAQVSTTQAYTGDFDQETKKKIAGML